MIHAANPRNRESSTLEGTERLDLRIEISQQGIRIEPVIFAVAVGAWQSGEQVFLHDVQMLKHRTFGLGRIALRFCRPGC